MSDPSRKAEREAAIAKGAAVVRDAIHEKFEQAHGRAPRNEEEAGKWFAKIATQTLVGRKAVVTERAVIQRINRKLAADELVLKTTRGARMRQNVGDHYILNWRHNLIADAHIDPETYARELGVLAPWEEVATA